MTVRDGRVKRTETVSNSTHPEWNEELQFIVDDPDTQSVSVIVKDDDAFNDTVSLVGPKMSPNCMYINSLYELLLLYSPCAVTKPLRLT